MMSDGRSTSNGLEKAAGKRHTPETVLLLLVTTCEGEWGGEAPGASYSVETNDAPNVGRVPSP
jgi:hypothetical protein